jgi:hypothetical protein
MSRNASQASVEELLEQEARASESNRDAPVKPGTKVSPGHGRSKVYSVRLNQDEVEQLEQVAEHLGLPPSTMVRSWIVERLPGPQIPTRPWSLWCAGWSVTCRPWVRLPRPEAYLMVPVGGAWLRSAVAPWCQQSAPHALSHAFHRELLRRPRMG